MLVEITDQAGTNGTVIVDRHDFAEAVRPWFPTGDPGFVSETIDQIQDGILRSEDVSGLAEDLAITLTAVHRAEATLGGLSQAAYLAESVHGVEIGEDGRTVTLSAAALGVLAGLDEDYDGYFDGRHIWIGGSEYAVERV